MILSAGTVLVVVVALVVIGFSVRFTDDGGEMAAPSASEQVSPSQVQIPDAVPVDLKINSVPVTAGEFRYALNEVKADVVSACGSGERSIGAEFWIANSGECAEESSFEPRSEIERTQAQMRSSYSLGSKELCAGVLHPVDFAVCKAVRLLEWQHAAYQQAVLGGQMRTGTWDEVVESLRTQNAINEHSDANETTVYGISTYDLPVYLSKYFSHLRDMYINDAGAPAMNVTDAQIMEHYLAHEWDFGDSIADKNTDEERWEVIKPSVETDLRIRLYYDLLASSIRSMRTEADPDSLVGFARSTFGQ